MTDDEHPDSPLDQIRAEQVRRWEQGERVRVELLLQWYATTFGEPADARASLSPEELLDVIYAEVLLREEAGEAVSVDEYLARFPELEQELRRQFDVHAALVAIESDHAEQCDADEGDDAGEAESSLSGNSSRVNPLLGELTLATGSTAAGTPLGMGMAKASDLNGDAPPRDSSNKGPANFPAPPRIEGYEILGELGRGGMGVVYKARHRHLKRIVALKVIRERALADATTLGRFRAEAEAVARLRHPHIVQIHDYGEHDATPYLALEFVDGGNLEAWTRQPVANVRDAAVLVELLARAIGYAHQQGIVHRDLKPANILLASPDGDSQFAESRSLDEAARGFMATYGVPKITDFGLAKQYSADSDLTHSAAILGTGAYMSPEQAWGHSRDVGPSTDVHSLGVILYELLTGRSPFRAESLIKTLDRVRFEPPPRPSHWRADLPPELDEIVMRCLGKTPSERYADGKQLAEELARFLSGKPLFELRSAAVSLGMGEVAPGTAVPNSRAESASASSHPTSAPRGTTRWLINASLGLTALLIALAVGMAFRDGRAPPGSTTGGQAGRQVESISNENGDTAAGPGNRTVPETFAFLVGVRSYRFADGALDLEYTESDVDELSRLLLKRGVPRRNIQLLTQWSEADNPQLAPTASNIRRRLKAMLSGCIEGDNVIVAITGMGGESGRSGVYCYMPAGARLDQVESLITLNEFFTLFENCAAGRKILLVDTCQTAALPDYALPELPVPRGVAALFACSRGEASFEHAQLKHGVFSYHLLEGLQGAADADRDGAVSVGELHQFAKRSVAAFVKENFNSATQTPSLLTALEPNSPVLAPITDGPK